MVGPATVLKGKWKLVKKVGQGAFGEIYSGNDVVTQDPVAVKLERWDNKKAVLKMEVAVLKKLQHCQFACRYVHCGHFEDHNYLVMELLGENLSELRRRRPGGRFSLWTTVRIGVQILKAVEAIHEIGYLHRDIKPSNFAMGLAPGRKDQCVMIDFGLTRKYRLPNGQIRPARDMAGFRGTARYASINSHLSKELARRDDLWSVLYVLIEFLTGQLPWRKLKDKEEIGLLKIHFNSAELVRDLPPPYLSFMQHLQALDYLDQPDYAMLSDLLHTLGGGVAEQTAYDWDSDAREGRAFGASDGPNNSSIGSVRRIDTPGREGDVSTNEQQSVPLEERGRALQSFSLHDDAGAGAGGGSSSLVTPGRPRSKQSESSVGSELRVRSSTGRTRVRRQHSQSRQRPEEPQESTFEPPTTTVHPAAAGTGTGGAGPAHGPGGVNLNMDGSVPSSSSSRFVRSAAETLDGSDKAKQGREGERQHGDKEDGPGRERREKLRERLRERQEAERAEGRRADGDGDVASILANRRGVGEAKPGREGAEAEAEAEGAARRTVREEAAAREAAKAKEEEEREKEREREREMERKVAAEMAQSKAAAEEMRAEKGRDSEDRGGKEKERGWNGGEEGGREDAEREPGTGRDGGEPAVVQNTMGGPEATPGGGGGGGVGGGERKIERGGGGGGGGGGSGDSSCKCVIS